MLEAILARRLPAGRRPSSRPPSRHHRGHRRATPQESERVSVRRTGRPTRPLPRPPGRPTSSAAPKLVALGRILEVETRTPLVFAGPAARWTTLPKPSPAAATMRRRSTAESRRTARPGHPGTVPRRPARRPRGHRRGGARSRHRARLARRQLRRPPRPMRTSTGSAAPVRPVGRGRRSPSSTARAPAPPEASVSATRTRLSGDRPVVAICASSGSSCCRRVCESGWRPRHRRQEDQQHQRHGGGRRGPERYRSSSRRSPTSSTPSRSPWPRSRPSTEAERGDAEVEIAPASPCRRIDRLAAAAADRRSRAGPPERTGAARDRGARLAGVRSSGQSGSARGRTARTGAGGPCVRSGRRRPADGVRAGDLVGAITAEAGVQGSAVGPFPDRRQLLARSTSSATWSTEWSTLSAARRSGSDASRTASTAICASRVSPRGRSDVLPDVFFVTLIATSSPAPIRHRYVVDLHRAHRLRCGRSYRPRCGSARPRRGHLVKPRRPRSGDRSWWVTVPRSPRSGQYRLDIEHLRRRRHGASRPFTRTALRRARPKITRPPARTDRRRPPRRERAAEIERTPARARAPSCAQGGS